MNAILESVKTLDSISETLDFVEFVKPNNYPE